MTRSKDVSREKYTIFMRKAEEYYKYMKQAFNEKANTACVTMAVHCAISATDALTVLKLGKKSSGQNHAEAISLLKDVRASDEGEKSRVCQKLYELIELKNPAEYQDVEISRREAEQAKNLCDKIYSFIKAELGG